MIASLRIASGHLLFLPLCPSTNARMQPVRFGNRCQDILTKEARTYIQGISMALKLWANQVNFMPIHDYAWMDLWFILPRTNCDAHNYGKVLFDALENGGIVTNDKFILPRVMGVWHQTPGEIVIKLPCQQFELLMDRKGTVK
jgi:Holliday junction resolvase RusA-like endonuclease